ncbi:hypothetical protein BX661DRAFT_187375 [Kickxella alabastrina]|uniref:uncharacterized protein n=1 Tax=Kickxella alabastrina TaxID=61397 RepID=UPI00221E52CE|nr:uncharacterized protein BX661DRAFT_187375 [Kickxella alabastrina]KAI7822427.1 hypothetical protein BX661DRAFT_187375 [Kickxella alabastrina]
MPKKTKSSRSEFNTLRTDSDEADSVNERSTWNPEDTDNFHWVLSKHTEFKNGKLELNHRYLDARDISIVEKMEAKFSIDKTKSNEAIDEEIIAALEKANESNTGKNCRRVFGLLRKLQNAAGNKYTVRQINTKHINTRSRWSVPFLSLYERGAKAMEVKKSESVPQRTNIEKKNLAAIKALLKYTTHRHLFWCDETDSIPAPKSLAHLEKTDEMPEDTPEPGRWTLAMIKRHGKIMCTVNIANTYIQELKEKGVWVSTHDAYTADTPRAVLANLVDEVVSLPKAARKSRLSSAKEMPMSAQETKMQAFHADKPTKSSIIERPADLKIGFNLQTALNSGIPRSNKRDTSPNHSYPQAYGNSCEYNYDEDIKRSKSLVFSDKSSQSHDAQQDASFYDLSSYANMSMLANNGFAQNNNKSNQFINFDSNASAPITSAAMYPSDNLGYADSSANQHTPPSDLLEAIVNLSVNSSTGANSTNQVQNGQFADTYNHHSTSPAHDPTPIKMQRLANNKSKFSDMQSHKGIQHGNGQDIPLAFTLGSPESNQYPSLLSRALSDEQYTPNGLSYWAPHDASASALTSVTAGPESQGFTFQLPNSWSDEGTMNESAPRTPNIQQTRAQNGSLTGSYSTSNLTQLQFGIDKYQVPMQSNQQNHQVYSQSPVKSNIQGGNMMPPVYSMTQPQVSSLPIPQSAGGINGIGGQNKMSTTLVIVNGVPSHIELTHNNGSVHQNPIILPISQVLKENN